MEQKINQYLANLAVWNVKLHNLHWNVVGPAFVQVHEYTEKLYDNVFEQYDEVAELLKMAGRAPLVRMADYLQVASIEELAGSPKSCCEVIGIVQADMEKMVQLAGEIRAEAEKCGCFQTQALFEGFLADYAKQRWFLRAMTQDASSAPAGTCCKA